jgi:TRAP-type transport system small permease protein
MPFRATRSERPHPSRPRARGFGDDNDADGVERSGRGAGDWLKPVEGIAEAAALVMFVAMMLATLLQILARYFLRVPLPWTEELARTLFVASMTVGIALAVRRREHIVVDFVFVRFLPGTKAMASLVFDAAILLFLAVWLWGALLLIELNADAAYVSLPWLRVAHIYAVEAAAIVLMMAFVLADAVRQYRILRFRRIGRLR